MKTWTKILLGGGTAAALALVAAAGIRTRHGPLLATAWRTVCPPCSGIVWTAGTGTTCRAPTRNVQSPLVDAARRQVGVTVTYDPAYVKLAYPGGDVPPDRGVCADVVIRAFRDARGLDLQKLVHEDMAANFEAYPKRWGLRKPDANIDHRRVLNLEVFFRRQGWEVPVSTNSAAYLPGDIVACTVAGNLPHIMIVSDRKSAAGIPLVLHNIGNGTREEDRLFAFPQTSHFRPSQTRGRDTGLLENARPGYRPAGEHAAGIPAAGLSRPASLCPHVLKSVECDTFMSLKVLSITLLCP